MGEVADRFDWEISLRLLEACQPDSLTDEQLVALYLEVTYYLDFLELQDRSTASRLGRQAERLYQEIVSRPRLRRMGVVRQYINKMAATLQGRDPERRRGRKRDPQAAKDVVRALRANAPRRLIARALQQEGEADLEALEATQRRPGRPRLGDPDPPAPDDVERKRRKVYRHKEMREFMERVTVVHLPWPVRKATT